MSPNAAPLCVYESHSQLLTILDSEVCPLRPLAATPFTHIDSTNPPARREWEPAVLGPGGAALRATASALLCSPPAPAGEAAPAARSAAGEQGRQPPPRRAMAAADPRPAPGAGSLPPARPPKAGCVAAAAKRGLRSPGATAEVRDSPRGEPAPQLPAPGPALWPRRPAA